MPAERPGFPFRIFLPLLQLLVCLVLLLPNLPMLRNQLSLAIRELSARVLGTEPPPESSAITLDVTPFSPQHEQPLDLAALRLTAPAALNIPVGFIQIPFMIANTSRSEWAPKGMWIREWRAVSWPVVGMFFWWLAGRGMEALAAGLRLFASSRKQEAVRRFLLSPDLHWIEVAIGAALILLGSATCYTLGSGRGLLGLTTDYMLAAGGGLWAVLGLLIVSAGFVQWRVRQIDWRERLAAAEATAGT